jgi:molecular chaperone GrpE
VSPRKGNGSGNRDRDDDAPLSERDEEAGRPTPSADDAEAEPTGLEETPQSAAESLEALRRERDELKHALLRRRADFENYKKRVERDQQAAARDAAADLLRRLVDTIDNLERALAARGGEDALRQGVELTLRDLWTMLEGQGVGVVDPLGERFDPLRHQALLHEPVAGFAEGTVAEVFRKGYTYKDRLLRPALVKVSSGEELDAAAGGDTGGGELQ